MKKLFLLQAYHMMSVNFMNQVPYFRLNPLLGLTYDLCFQDPWSL